jgi:glutathione S-transferase
MLKVWGRRNSGNVQKVMWLVGELGLAHEHVAVGGPFGGLDAPSFRAMNPHGKVPVIEDDGLAIWESHAIVRYLAERDGGARFWPSLSERARIDPWMDWCQATFQPDFLGGIFWGFFRTPEAQRDWPAIRRAEAACAAHMRLFDKILEGRPYIAGDDLTLADIPLGANMFRYFTLEIERPDVPNVRAWYERLSARPAYREHVMVSYEDLRGRLSF